MNRVSSVLILTIGIGAGLYRAFAQPPGVANAPSQQAPQAQPVAAPPVQAPPASAPQSAQAPGGAPSQGMGGGSGPASPAGSAPGPAMGGGPAHNNGPAGAAPANGAGDLNQAGQSITVKSEIKKTNEEARAGIQDYLKFRDPFKQPETQKSSTEQLTDLEKYPVSEFKLTGVMTGPKKMRAMILAPDGKTHFVSEKMKIGNKNGIIAKITTKSLVVKEKLVNALGEEELIETEMSMAADTVGSKK